MFNVKLKFEDGDQYAEAMVPISFAQKVWDRFKQGDTVEDSLSFFGVVPAKAQRSRRLK